MSSESWPPPPPPARRRVRWLIAAIVMIATAMVVIGAMFTFSQRWYLNTNVTIPLSYVGDDGQTYSCTYDYRTSDRLPMPDAIAEEMNDRDWSETGQLIYEWAKAHPDASWSLAMDRYIEFPPWTVDTDNGREYELWTEARPGSNCEDGLR